MLIESFADRIGMETRVNRGRRLVAVVQDAPDEGERRAGLRHPAAEGSAQVVDPDVLDAASLAHARPAVVELDDVLPLAGAVEHVGVFLKLRDRLEKLEGVGRQRQVVRAPGLGVGKPQLAAGQVDVVPLEAGELRLSKARVQVQPPQLPVGRRLGVDGGGKLRQLVGPHEAVAFHLGEVLDPLARVTGSFGDVAPLLGAGEHLGQASHDAVGGRRLLPAVALFAADVRVEPDDVLVGDLADGTRVPGLGDVDLEAALVVLPGLLALLGMPVEVVLPELGKGLRADGGGLGLLHRVPPVEDLDEPGAGEGPRLVEGQDPVAAEGHVAAAAGRAIADHEGFLAAWPDADGKVWQKVIVAEVCPRGWPLVGHLIDGAGGELHGRDGSFPESCGCKSGHRVSKREPMWSIMSDRGKRKVAKDLAWSIVGHYEWRVAVRFLIRRLHVRAVLGSLPDRPSGTARQRVIHKVSTECPVGGNPPRDYLDPLKSASEAPCSAA